MATDSRPISILQCITVVEFHLKCCMGMGSTLFFVCVHSFGLDCLASDMTVVFMIIVICFCFLAINITHTKSNCCVAFRL